MAEITKKIVNKKIEHHVKDSSVNTISLGNEMGNINILIEQSQDDVLKRVNSLYVGNEHIASGYGFNKTTKDSILKLIGNENIQKVIKGDAYREENESTNSSDNNSSADIQYEPSEIFVNGDKIKLNENNELEYYPDSKADLITLFNIEIKYKIRNYLNQEFTYTIKDKYTITCSSTDKLFIEYIKFDFIAKRDIKYISVNQNQLNYEKRVKENNGNNLIKFKNEIYIPDTENLDGQISLNNRQSCKIIFADLLEIDNTSEVLDIYFANNGTGQNIDFIYKDICNINFQYEIFGSTNEEPILTNKAKKYNDNEYRLSTINTNDSFNYYIFIPDKYGKNISFILESSNIAVNFIEEDNTIEINDIIYNVWKSNWEYRFNAQNNWIIKIW